MEHDTVYLMVRLAQGAIEDLGRKSLMGKTLEDHPGQGKLDKLESTVQ